MKKNLLILILLLLNLPALAADFKSDSLYNSTTAWRDSSSNEVQLSSFRGHNVILTMAYTSCTYTCPMIIAKLKEIEAALTKKGVQDYKIVIASFDSTRDTPEKLKKYVQDKKLSARWSMLSPKADKDVRELAALLGVNYSKDKQGEYSHSNIISLLNHEGIIRQKINGVAADHDDLVTELAGKPDGR